MKRIRISLGLVLGILMTTLVSAQTHCRHDYGRYGYDRHDRYERNRHYDYVSTENLEAKIERAARRGELSGRELRKIEKELYELKRLERKYYNNHRISRHERKRLEYEKIELNRLIDEYSHNWRR
jgi:dsDNA-specific endonuclease/ATPase MutS2